MKKINRWWLGGNWVLLYFPGLCGNYRSWRKDGKIPVNADVVYRKNYGKGNALVRLGRNLRTALKK